MKVFGAWRQVMIERELRRELLAQALPSALPGGGNWVAFGSPSPPELAGGKRRPLRQRRAETG